MVGSRGWGSRGGGVKGVVGSRGGGCLRGGGYLGVGGGQVVVVV